MADQWVDLPKDEWVDVETSSPQTRTWGDTAKEVGGRAIRGAVGLTESKTVTLGDLTNHPRQALSDMFSPERLGEVTRDAGLMYGTAALAPLLGRLMSAGIGAAKGGLSPVIGPTVKGAIQGWKESAPYRVSPELKATPPVLVKAQAGPAKPFANTLAEAIAAEPSGPSSVQLAPHVPEFPTGGGAPYETPAYAARAAQFAKDAAARQANNQSYLRTVTLRKPDVAPLEDVLAQQLQGPQEIPSAGTTPPQPSLTPVKGRPSISAEAYDRPTPTKTWESPSYKANMAKAKADYQAQRTREAMLEQMSKAEAAQAEAAAGPQQSVPLRPEDTVAILKRLQEDPRTRSWAERYYESLAPK